MDTLTKYAKILAALLATLIALYLLDYCVEVIFLTNPKVYLAIGLLMEHYDAQRCYETIITRLKRDYTIVFDVFLNPIDLFFDIVLWFFHEIRKICYRAGWFTPKTATAS